MQPFARLTIFSFHSILHPICQSQNLHQLHNHDRKERKFASLNVVRARTSMTFSFHLSWQTRRRKFLVHSAGSCSCPMCLASLKLQSDWSLWWFRLHWRSHLPTCSLAFFRRNPKCRRCKRWLHKLRVSFHPNRSKCGSRWRQRSDIGRLNLMLLGHGRLWTSSSGHRGTVLIQSQWFLLSN